jgi:hypothetical protein
MKTKSIRKLYSGILIAGIGLLGLAPGLAAQIMPQNNWYIEREFTAPVIGGMKNPSGIGSSPRATQASSLRMGLSGHTMRTTTQPTFPSRRIYQGYNFG